MPRWINLPNSLTLVRLLLAPAVVWAILSGRPWLALALFGFAAVTDVLDGAAARGLGLVTPFGAYLDPIADKCLLSSVFPALAAIGAVPWWLVAVIFGRDIAILAGAAILLRFTGRRKFPPSVWGKASTFVQIVTAVAGMAAGVLGPGPARAAAALAIWPCAALTIWSGMHYAWQVLGRRAAD